MILTFIIILGLAMGSFINALVWRLRKKRDFVKERSVCEHCEHTLAWYDLVPIVSYLSLGGKCRYCNKKISPQHLVTEIVMGAAFALAYSYWPIELAGTQDWLLFGIFLAITSVMFGLLLYDIAWLELPDSLIRVLAGLVTASLLIQAVNSGDLPELIKDSALGILIGGGLFYLLYQVSDGKWIGGGDVKFGFVMGAYTGALGSAIALMLAFYSAALFVIPLMLIGKLHRKSKVPFGPFLIFGFFVVGLWFESLSEFVNNWLSY